MPRDQNQQPTPQRPADPMEPTRDRVPPRRRGGQELPDEVQDRPEQNAGYDEAVHEGPGRGGAADVPPDPTDRTPLEELRDPAERSVSDVRRSDRQDR